MIFDVDDIYEIEEDYKTKLEEKDKEIKRLKSRLEEYQEYVEINHKEIERLKEDNEYLNKVNIELFTEKNRLNNIINELEKWVEEKFKIENTQYYYVIDANDLKRKLQKLKGSDK